MQVADVVRSERTSGLGDSPDPSDAAVIASGQSSAASSQFQARAVTPAHLSPPPTSPLGLAAYSGLGPALWFSSCHGGAGSSTLVTLVPYAWSAGRYWPAPEPTGQARVLLVARTHAAGLGAAQAAARQWASGVLPNVRLLGLVAVADAPGRLPKPLKDLLRLISGGVPQIWELPWVEALRLGVPPAQAKLPSAYTRLAQDLNRIISEDARA